MFGLGIEVLVTQPLLTAESVTVPLILVGGQDPRGDGGFLGGRNTAVGSPETEAGPPQSYHLAFPSLRPPRHLASVLALPWPSSFLASRGKVSWLGRLWGPGLVVRGPHFGHGGVNGG